MPGGNECSCRRGCYPNGQALIIPGLLASLAWVLSIVTLCLCDLFKSNNTEYKYGLFQYKDEDYCEDYNPDYEITSAWAAARAFSIIAVVLGFIVMVLVFTAGCVAFKLVWFKIFGAMLFFCFLSEAFVFLWLSSAESSYYDCTLDGPSGVPITSCIFWLASMVTVCIFAQPSREPEDIPALMVAPGPTATVTSTTATTAPAPGQSVVKKTEVVNPDGTKTVTIETVPA